MTVSFEERLEQDIPGSLPVYELVAPEPGEVLESVLGSVGPVVGFGKPTPSREDADDDWQGFVEGPHVLRVHVASGAVRYVHAEKYGLPGERPCELSDDEALGRAESFLGRLPVDAGDETSLLKVTRLRMTTASRHDSADRQERVLDAGVVFGRTVEGIPVDGPGAFGMVNLDPDGEVVGFRRVWRRRAKPVTEVRIEDAEAVLARVQKHVEKEPGDVVVTRARFGYFEQGHSERQGYLQPAYSFVYRVDTGTLGYKRILVFAAGTEVLEPLQGEKRFATEPQPARRPKATAH